MSGPVTPGAGGSGASGQLTAVTSILFPASDATPSISQAQAAAGVGAMSTLYAQQGAPGSVGGINRIGGGPNGTPGSGLAGATQIDLGQLFANQSAKASHVVGPAGSQFSILDVSRTAANETSISVPDASAALKLNATNHIIATAGGVMQLISGGGNDINFDSSSKTANYRTTGSVVGRVDKFDPAGAGSIAWAAGSTAITYSQTTTASATGAATTIQAQNAATTGGALNLTSGTAATAGAVQIQVGGATKIKADPTGLGFYGAATVAQAARAGQLTVAAGTPSTTTTTDVGAAFNQSTLNNNIATLATKLNLVEAIIHNVGLSA